jgi:endoglucanase
MPVALHTCLFVVILCVWIRVSGQPSIKFRADDPGILELQWPSVVGKRYEVLGGTDLSGLVPVARGLMANHPGNLWWKERGSNNRGFFRILEQVTVGQQELLVNGGFDLGFSAWFTNTAQEAAATYGVKDGELEIEITNGGTANWHLQLIQPGFRLRKWEVYRLQLEARSLGGSRPFKVQVQSTSEPAANTYFVKELMLDASRQKLDFNFKMDRTDPSARVSFSMGTSSADLVLDNIKLSEGLDIQNRTNAHQMVERMSGGNNFMAAKIIHGHARMEDFELLRRSGYSHCRIGYKMDEFAGDAPGFVIPSMHEQYLLDAVSLCLQEGLIAVVDPVHNWANGPGYTHPDDLPRLRAIWRQVAAMLAGQPLDQVVFEIVNEPHDDDNVPAIIQAALEEIRGVPGNGNRQVILSGQGFSTRGALIKAFDDDIFPVDDPCVIGTFHYYDPFTFTKQGKENADPPPPVTWGTPEEIDTLIGHFDEVVTANHAWATRNNTEPFPIYLGEFGVDNAAPPVDRKRWLAMVRMEAESRGFAWAHWNMYGDGSSSKGMGPWTSSEVSEPGNRIFQADAVEAMTARHEAEEGILRGGVQTGSANSGYTGSGYIVFPDEVGAGVSVEQDVYIPLDGTYAVHIRYASDVSHTLTLVSMDSVGGEVARRVVRFASTGGMMHWSGRTIDLAFRSGEQSRLQIIAETQAGPSIDGFRISR